MWYVHTCGTHAWEIAVCACVCRGMGAGCCVGDRFELAVRLPCRSSPLRPPLELPGCCGRTPVGPSPHRALLLAAAAVAAACCCRCCHCCCCFCCPAAAAACRIMVLMLSFTLACTALWSGCLAAHWATQVGAAASAAAAAGAFPYWPGIDFICSHTCVCAFVYHRRLSAFVPQRPFSSLPFNLSVHRFVVE